nr:TBC1 domain family member 19-like [Misgurnus anguillicaudatus]
MRKAQAAWEKRITKSLNSMCTELGIPLARERSVSMQKELTNKWNDLGTEEPGDGATRSLLSDFTPCHVLEVTSQWVFVHALQNVYTQSFGLYTEALNSPITMLSVCSVHDNITADTGINHF